MRFGVGNDCRKRCFAARARRCGDCNERRKFVTCEHDLQHAFHLRNGLLGASDSCTDTFCTIHCASAAESDDCVTTVLMIHLQAVFDVLNGRIGHDVVIAAALHAFRLASFHDGICFAVGEQNPSVTIKMLLNPLSLRNLGSCEMLPGPDNVFLH